MKVCTRCKINKEDSAFRVRHEKKKNRPNIYRYLNNTCRKCEIEIQREYYLAMKDDPRFKEKNRLRARRYEEENRDILIEKDKLKRQTFRYKRMMKNYRQKNKERISAQEKVTKKRYHEKNRDALTDLYVGARLAEQTGIARNELPPALIQLSRLQILAKRTLKLKNHESHRTTRPDVASAI